MSILGSVKNRLKTMFIINKNKKYKLEKEREEKKVTIIYKKPKLVLKKIKVKKIVIPKIEQPVLVEIKKIGKPKTIKKTSNITNNIVSKLPNNLTNKEKLATKEDITRRFKIFIKSSKNEIKKIKQELTIEEKNIKQIKNEQDLIISQERIQTIKEKLTNLINLYNNILYNYDFKGYEEINDFLLTKYIDDFKFNNSILSIDSLVNECKNNIDYLDEINILTDKLEKIEIKKDNKKQKINYLNKDYNNRIIDYDKLLNKKNTIDRYIFKENEYLTKLEQEINDNTLNTKVISKLKFDYNYINNLYKLNIGLNLFNKTYIGAFIGAFIIKNSLTPLLLKAFKKENIIKYSYKYEEYTKRITDNLSIVKQTNYLLTDSLKDITLLKQYMEKEYKEYLQVEEYSKLYKKIVLLEKDLNIKKKNTITLENKLLEQKIKNEEKQKRLTKLNQL